MKSLKISLTATMAVLLLVLVTGGFAAAQSTDGSFVRGFLANATPNADGTILAGDTVSVGIFYQNNSTETVILDYAFVHFDWMPTDSVLGFNLSSYDIQVASGDDYFFPQPINMKIPTTASGNHSYYAGIDAHTATSPAISLTSDPVEFIVIGSGATTYAHKHQLRHKQPGWCTGHCFLRSDNCCCCNSSCAACGCFYASKTQTRLQTC